MFDQFENNDDITTVVISAKMFQMLSKIGSKDSDSKEFTEIAKQLKSMKIFTTSNKDATQKIKNEVNNYLKSNNLEEFMRVKEKDNNVKFYVKQGRKSDIVSELLMFIEANDKNEKQTVLMTLVGEIDLNKIGTLTKNITLISGEK